MGPMVSEMGKRLKSYRDGCEHLSDNTTLDWAGSLKSYRDGCELIPLYIVNNFQVQV